MNRRMIIISTLTGLAAILLILLGFKGYCDTRFFDGYNPDIPLHQTPPEKKVVDTEQEAFHITSPAHYRLEKVTFEARPGERIPALITLPFEEKKEPMPAIVLLHGSHQEKEFVEKICTPFNEAGFVMACFDQYGRGERRIKGAGGFEQVFIFRERTWKTVHDARRMIDYLLTRPDIDPDRIYLVGASYGAITGTTVVAMDKRIKAAILVVGGAKFPLMAKSPVVQKSLPGWLRPIAGFVLWFGFNCGDPIHTAPDTEGTPVLMLNGSKDLIVIPEAGQALFDALGDPKDIRWYPVNHPDREENGEEVHRMLSDGMQWLFKHDAAIQKGQKIAVHE